MCVWHAHACIGAQIQPSGSWVEPTDAVQAIGINLPGQLRPLHREQMLLHNSFLFAPGQLLCLHEARFLAARLPLSAARCPSVRTRSGALGRATATTDMPAIALPPPEAVETSMPLEGAAAGAPAVISSRTLHGALHLRSGQ